MEELFVDLCRVLNTFEGKDLNKMSSNNMEKTFRNVKSTNKISLKTLFNENSDALNDYGSTTTAFNLEPQDLFIKQSKAIAKGASGSIYKGHFGVGSGTMEKIIVKENVEGTPKTDALELLMQAFLFCDFRGMRYATEAGMKGAAKIPKPLFAANHNKKKRYLGMQTLDQDCNKYLEFKKNETSEEHWNRFVKLTSSLLLCLDYMQRHFEFVHGDLHLGNVMVTLFPFKVYVIDFGRSAMNMWGKRQHADDEFKWPVSPSVDLIIFYTSVCDLLGESNHKNSKTYKFCKSQVDKVYDKILGPKSLKDVASPYKSFRKYYDKENDSESSDWWMFVMNDKLFDIYEEDLVPSNALEILRKN